VSNEGERIARLETRSNGFDKDHSENREDHIKIFSRLNRIEIRIAFYAGGGAVVGGLIPWLAGKVFGG